MINLWSISIIKQEYKFSLILFILKRYFILNVNVIEIQNIEDTIIENNLE